MTPAWLQRAWWEAWIGLWWWVGHAHKKWSEMPPPFDNGMFSEGLEP